MHDVDIFRVGHGLQIHVGAVAAHRRELARLIENVGDAAGHARCEVAARLAEHHDQTACHVLAAVVADAFHDGRGAGIAHREPLSRHAVQENFSAGRAVQADVADQNIFFRHERRIARRINDQPSAGKSLAHVIVGFAFQGQRDALRQERAETLSRAPVELHADGVLGQALGAVPPRDSPAEHRAHGAVHVANGQAER